MTNKIETATEKFFNKLQQKIETAQKENKPIKDLVKQQIKLLQEAHDEFVLNAKNRGYDSSDPVVGKMEIQQYSAMKALAKKIGLPVEQYDELIKNVKIRVLGEENYKKFFEQK